MAGVIAKPDEASCGMTLCFSDGAAHGEVIILLNDTGSATAKGTVCRIGYDTTLNQLAAVAVADSAVRERIVVSSEVIASGAYGRFWIRGSGITATVADTTYTADDGLRMYDGTVTDMTAGYAFDDNEFGVVETGGDTTTSIVITLLGRESLGET